jgi:hypothetical protein
VGCVQCDEADVGPDVDHHVAGRQLAVEEVHQGRVVAAALHQGGCDAQVVGEGEDRVAGCGAHQQRAVAHVGGSPGRPA